ncbi:MAG: ABC transporter ATP-binding protein [Victivallales bacterium]|nr:ABC transporter ATP-binding protein [Victivallales bacterium]
MALLNVQDLSIEFKVDGKWLSAVDKVSFSVKKGEILAIVGESGCGKSVTCHSLARLLPQPPARYSSGRILFSGKNGEKDILSLSKRELREVRGGGIAYVFQEPASSLNPVFRIGDQIAEAITLHRRDVNNVKAEAAALLRQVGIPEPEQRLKCYPHELSGGMQQRVMIAMALASNPELLVADEPTTALDVTIQAQILDLLRKIGQERDMAIIIVTHNLGIVAELAHRVVVMYAGHNVEEAPVQELLAHPRHPYTQALLAAVPRLGHENEQLTTIPGAVPSPADFPSGCRFYGRCQACIEHKLEAKCPVVAPERSDFGNGHYCRCWLY